MDTNQGHTQTHTNQGQTDIHNQNHLPPMDACHTPINNTTIHSKCKILTKGEDTQHKPRTQHKPTAHIDTHDQFHGQMPPTQHPGLIHAYTYYTPGGRTSLHRSPHATGSELQRARHNETMIDTSSLHKPREHTHIHTCTHTHTRRKQPSPPRPTRRLSELQRARQGVDEDVPRHEGEYHRAPEVPIARPDLDSDVVPSRAEAANKKCVGVWTTEGVHVLHITGEHNNKDQI